MLMEGLSVRSPKRSEGMGTRGKHVNRCASSTCRVVVPMVRHRRPRPLRRWATSTTIYPATTRPTYGRLEFLGLSEDYRLGLSIRSSTLSWSNCRSRCHLWWGGFCQGAPLNRYPVPDWVLACPRV